jgi:hypothetical protein
MRELALGARVRRARGTEVKGTRYWGEGEGRDVGVRRSVCKRASTTYSRSPEMETRFCAVGYSSALAGTRESRTSHLKMQKCSIKKMPH